MKQKIGVPISLIIVLILTISYIPVAYSVDAYTYDNDKYAGFQKIAILMSTADPGEEEDYIISEGENVVWKFIITVTNLYDWDMTEVVVTDNFGAEIEIDYIELKIPEDSILTIVTTGTSEKIHLTWEIGTIPPGGQAKLILTISTDLNPAGHQEYTSPGCYDLNSGAVLKFKDERGKQVSFHTENIIVCTDGGEYWPEGGTATIGYEDLPLEGPYGGLNDYDYNDFIVDISIVAKYCDDCPSAVITYMTFLFESQARGAALNHEFHVVFPAMTFEYGGGYYVQYFDNNGDPIGEITELYDNTVPLDITVFPDTHLAQPSQNYPPDLFASNTVDGSGIEPGRQTRVTFTFSTPIEFSFPAAETIGPHCEGLWFDPVLHVPFTGEEINIEDVRILFIPRDWEWPQEKVSIDQVYPYQDLGGGNWQGVTAGTPPTFTLEWYTVVPTSLKWTP